MGSSLFRVCKHRCIGRRKLRISTPRGGWRPTHSFGRVLRGMGRGGDVRGPYCCCCLRYHVHRCLLMSPTHILARVYSLKKRKNLRFLEHSCPAKV